MSKFFDIILNTFYHLASLHPSELDLAVKKDESFQLALAFYIEYYGPHMRSLPSALSRIIHNENRITSNTDGLIKAVLHHPCIKPLAIYHSHKIYPQKKSSGIVLEIISSILFKKNYSIEDYIQEMDTHHQTWHKSFYEYDLDIREVMFHPFFGLACLNQRSMPNFKEPYFNQIYWGNALLHCICSPQEFDSWRTLYATYVELMVQACLSNPPANSVNDNLYVIKHDLNRNQEIDTLNKILVHINGWTSDLKLFNANLMYAANDQRKTLDQTFFDDDTINLLIEKIQQNINKRVESSKLGLFDLKTIQNMTSSDLNAMSNTTIF